ncbi:MAG: hypothetical protein IPK86_01755 [Neisseriales bacterium]|nr:MAG: hypothetical protein IPK86_01755 [Neisseriales bacterium]
MNQTIKWLIVVTGLLTLTSCCSAQQPPAPIVKGMTIEDTSQKAVFDASVEVMPADTETLTPTPAEASTIVESPTEIPF